MENGNSTDSAPMLHMGGNTYKVPITLFEENRERLCSALHKVAAIKSSSYVLLQGGDNVPFYDTDVDYVFRQESYFMWTMGVLEPGCYAAMDVGSTDANPKCTLFVPHLPEDYAIWMGPLLTLDDFKKKYNLQEVLYTEQLNEYFTKKNPSQILTLKGVNSDSGLESKEAYFKGIENFTVNNTLLYDVISECRVIKTSAELDVLRHVVKLSSEAHRKVMREAKPGWLEYQCESVFLDHCYRVGGARYVSYTCICGSGTNGSILHYGHSNAPNNKRIHDGDMCLFDMGANYFGYCADITCSFPVNGKFTADQKLVYETVLKANNAVKNALKPGVSWVDMHLLANKVTLECLKEGGLLKGDVDEMIQEGVNYIFQPHGLGHFMGCDVHDVGGYLADHPERPKAPGVSKLRTARVLKPGMVLTVEPGCYFIKPLLDKALSDPKMSKFFVPNVVERFRKFGGVRIEDDIIITENGCEDMTKVPRNCEEIERWMAGQDDDKY